MATNPKGYLSRNMMFNNPAYLRWKDRPVGLNEFPRYTPVKIMKPTKAEMDRLRKIAIERNAEAFVVELEGQRVYLTRESLLTPEEYDEIRHQEDTRADDQKSRQRAKLALLKDQSRDLGQSDI